MPVKIMHVIAAVEGGGAETMLYQLLKSQCGQTHLAHVVSLTDMIGPVGKNIQSLGVPVSTLRMKRGRVSVGALIRLVRLMATDKPDLVQTWMYHADLLGGLVATMLRVPVIWGVRHQHNGEDKALTRGTRRLCALLSSWIPDSVVFNSESAMLGHARAGYVAHKLVVIGNGFDVSRFRPDAQVRREVRRELGISDEAPVVGLVARFHPDKDHRTFVAAAARLRKGCPLVRFVLCGEGVVWRNRDLVAIIDEHGLRSATHLLGNRSDMERLYPAFDVACLSSRTESFPNVLGEAMACAVPCISTDCGAAREILGETGEVVPIADPAALASAVLAVLRQNDEDRAALGAAARSRIEKAYDLGATVSKFAEVQARAFQQRKKRTANCSSHSRGAEGRVS